MENIPTLDELKKLRRPVKNYHSEYHEKLNALDQAAVWITKRVGTMGFFLIIIIWTIIWIGWNSMAPVGLRFDPYPEFVIWIMAVNLIQISLLPIIMIGQNLENKRSEIRAESDYDVNLKAEREIEVILMHLENIEKKLK